jgi:hypothetical protein
VAVAHRILIVAWSMLRNGEDYQERGGASEDQSRPERTARRLVSRLERIGFEVTVTRASQPKAALQKEKAARPKETTVPPGKCRKCSQWGLADCIHVRPKGVQIRQERSASSITDSIT